MKQSTGVKTPGGYVFLSPKIIREGAKGKKVYFGTGLASSKEVSRGFGFELLNTVLSSLALMRKLGADGVLHEIGTVGYDISEEQRERLIRDEHRLMVNMAENLGIGDIYGVILSHSYHGCDFFKGVLREVKAKLGPFGELPNFQSYGNYTAIQIAQMKYLYETENAALKVGWTVGSKPEPGEVDADGAAAIIGQGRLNEYYFDSLYRYVFPGDEFSFAYTQAGMDLANGMRYAPYTVTGAQNRPLLTEPIKPYLAKIPDSRIKRRAMKLYEKTVVNNWEYLFGEIEASVCLPADERLVGKLQYIQDRVLGEARAFAAEPEARARPPAGAFSLCTV